MKRKLLNGIAALNLFTPSPEELNGSQPADTANGGSDTPAPTPETPTLTPEEQIDAGRTAEEAKAAEADLEAQKEIAKKAVEEVEGEGEGEENKSEGDKESAEDRAVPEDPAEYDFTIPEDIGLKDDAGEPFQFDPEDPFLKEMREIAHADGVSQKGLNDIVALYAKVQKEAVEAQSAGFEKHKEEVITAETEKLSYRTKDGDEVTGKDRIKAILTAVETAGGKEMVTQLSPAFVNAEATIAIEKLLGLVSEGKIGDGKGNAGNDLDGLSGEDMLYKLRS